MKTGIVVLIPAAEGGKPKVVSEVLPLEEAVEKARKLRDDKKAAAGFAFVEIWTGAQRRFAIPQPAPEAPAAPSPPDPAEN